MKRRASALALLTALVAACGAHESAPAPPLAQAPHLEAPADAAEGTPRTGPGTMYNACERIWCMTHQRNFDLTHFMTGHAGWILHDDGSGDVFVPRNRTSGPEFPHARANVLALCGRHIHPYWLGARSGPVTKTGWNVALGYDRSHFVSYGTRIPECCLNADAWGFLHATAPREYRFGDRTTVAEMPGSGWQKAFGGATR